MSHVNIVKKIKVDGDWKLLSIPRNTKGNYDWNALPEGLYLIEWRAGGKRRRESAGVTAAQALEAQRRKRHELEGRKLGIPGFETAGETVKKPALHVAVNKYLEQIEALKKPNTHRKYEAVLKRFLDFFGDRDSIDAISGDDLTRFVVTLKKDHGLGSNTILHNAVIIAQFLKRHGRSGITRELPLSTARTRSLRGARSPTRCTRRAGTSTIRSGTAGAWLIPTCAAAHSRGAVCNPRHRRLLPAVWPRRFSDSTCAWHQ